MYLLSGILIAFLSNFSANYFQGLIDKFNDGSLSVRHIIIYGFVLIVLCILDFLDEYPGRSLEHGIYIDLKLKALNKKWIR
jgi:ATP-binding cassette subfamily B protein